MIRQTLTIIAYYYHYTLYFRPITCEKIFRSIALRSRNMSLYYNNVRNCTVPETHGYYFIYQ
jgi:hypothetical protein